MVAGPWLVLIGPAGAGKSTVGAGLAAAPGREFVVLDAVAGPYCAEVGWSMARVRRRIGGCGAALGRAGVGAGAGARRGVGGECVPRRGARRARQLHGRLLPGAVRAALPERCIRERGVGWRSEDGHDFLAEWLTDPFARSLATETVRTGGESPEQTVARLATRRLRT